MNQYNSAEQYTKDIIKGIKCGGAKRKEIRKQILSDIEIRLQEGEQLNEIISEMGNASEIADGFNESLTEKDCKSYKRGKALKIIVPCILVFVLIAGGIYWYIPKWKDITQSKHFDLEVLDTEVTHTLELINADDYSALQENATKEMKPYLNSETIGAAKDAICTEPGQQMSMTVNLESELVQRNIHMAVCEVTVYYENAIMTYRISYDEDMKLAGLYIR